MDNLVLLPEQLATLGELGAVTIPDGHQLNEIGNIWLWAYGDAARKAEIRYASERFTKALSKFSVWLDNTNTVGFVEFTYFFDMEGEVYEKPLTIAILNDVVDRAIETAERVTVNRAPLIPHRGSDDWLLPYVCLLLLEFERLGGRATTGSKNKQIRRNSNRDEPNNPRFLFVKKFTEYLKHAFDQIFHGEAGDAAGAFITLLAFKTKERSRLVGLIDKADDLRNEEGHLGFVQRFPIYLHQEVYAVINAEDR